MACPRAGPCPPTCCVSVSTQVLGTPSEETWPGVSSLPEFKKSQFKDYSRKELGFVIPE